MFLNKTKVLTLEEISGLEASQRMPTVVYLCILIILGSIGNSVVLLVYMFKYNRSNLRLYIICLAVLDMLACCVSMPAEVVDNYHPYMFYSDNFCKTQRFLGNMAKIGSAFVITLMAIERHRRVCGAFNATTCRYTPVYCGSAIVLSLVVSLPKVVISGTIVEQFPGNVTGYDCSVDESLMNTLIPFIYTIVQLVIFFVSFILLIVLYSLIVKSLWDQSKQPVHTGSRRGLRILKKSRKITKIMLAISVAFLVSYLPHLVLTTISTFRQEKNIQPPSNLVLGTFPLLHRSYFINNVVNPFIYAIADRQFRTICFETVSYLCKRKKRQIDTTCKNDDTIATEEMLATKRTSTQNII